MARRKGSYLADWDASLLLVVLAPGCAFRTLKKSIERVEEQVSLAGRASVRGMDTALVAAAHAMPSGELVDVFLLRRPIPFFFTLPAGTYRIGALDRSRIQPWLLY